MKAFHAVALFVTCAILWFLASSALSRETPDKLSIRLSPRVLFVGNDLTLTCHVPRDPRNRLLDYGVANYREHSQRDLHGESSPMTFQALIERLPCGSGPAYCFVARNDQTSEQVNQDFQLVGCEP